MKNNNFDKTLILSRCEIESLLSLAELIEGIKNAYALHASQHDLSPQRAVALIDDGSIVINFPGGLTGYNTYTVKTNTKISSNHQIGLPFVVGVVLLLDRATGLPLAVMESSLITAMRTCAAGAVGVAALARSGANKVAVLGAGSQCLWQLRALKTIGHLSRAWIYDVVPGRADNLAKNLTAELDVPVESSDSIKEATTEAEIIITVTQSCEPLITSELLRPGIHINAFGADEPGKVELSSEVLSRSLVVVDDRKLALSDGALNVAFNSNQINADVISAEIGEVLIGKHPGRTSDEQITVFGNVGLAFQDLVACQLVYDKAISSGLGVWMNFT